MGIPMERPNPATVRKALEFAHELAKSGFGFIVIPFTSDLQRDKLTEMLGEALVEFEKLEQSQVFD